MSENKYLIQLPNDQIRKLEYNSRRLENVCIDFDDRDLGRKCHGYYLILLDWYYTQGLTSDSTQDVISDKLATLLGFRENYCVKYRHKESIWGFKFNIQTATENEKFVLSLSEYNELALHLHSNFNPKLILPLLINLKNLIVDENKLSVKLWELLKKGFDIDLKQALQRKKVDQLSFFE
ncbi:MAG: hypothetical protein ACOCQR_03210 [bacterium]